MLSSLDNGRRYEQCGARQLRDLEGIDADQPADLEIVGLDAHDAAATGEADHSGVAFIQRVYDATAVEEPHRRIRAIERQQLSISGKQISEGGERRLAEHEDA